ELAELAVQNVRAGKMSSAITQPLFQQIAVAMQKHPAQRRDVRGEQEAMTLPQRGAGDDRMRAIACQRDDRLARAREPRSTVRLGERMAGANLLDVRLGMQRVGI